MAPNTPEELIPELLDRLGLAHTGNAVANAESFLIDHGLLPRPAADPAHPGADAPPNESVDAAAEALAAAEPPAAGQPPAGDVTRVEATGVPGTAPAAVETVPPGPSPDAPAADTVVGQVVGTVLAHLEPLTSRIGAVLDRLEGHTGS